MDGPHLYPLTLTKIGFESSYRSYPEVNPDLGLILKIIDPDPGVQTGSGSVTAEKAELALTETAESLLILSHFFFREAAKKLFFSVVRPVRPQPNPPSRA